MKLIQAVTAYMAAEQLAAQEWDYDFALAIVLTRRAAGAHAAFFVEQERKLVGEFAEKDERGAACFTGQGNFVFAQQERAGEYAEKRRRLCELEVLTDYVPLRVHAPQRIRPAHIEALEDFVTFEKEAGV